MSDIIDFPDFSAKDAAAIAANLLKRKRLGRVGTDILVEEAQKLVNAPDWANGRDVDAWVRRIAVESAQAGLDSDARVRRAATQDLLARKRGAVLWMRRPSCKKIS